jgi:hypothetical protein
MAMKPRVYRTGDLYLENTWSLHSILEHVQDPDSRWSNVGIFILDPDKDPASEVGVQVCLLLGGRLQLVELDTLLRQPQLQAAAHRSLGSSYRGQTTFTIENYLRSFLRDDVIIRQHSGALQNFLERESTSLNDPSPNKSKNNYTNLGTPVDSKGRDLKPPGFSKGNPNNARQTAFSPESLVIAALAAANVVLYDPEVPLSIFQEGGTLDTIYGSETPLFPRQPDESVRPVMENILIAAQQEALNMMHAYFKAKGKMAITQYQNYPPLRVNASRPQFPSELESDEEDLGNGGGIPETETIFVEQMSNYDRAARKGLTVQIAEEQGSETLDRKLRQRKGLAAKYTRPSPQFK